MKNYYKTIPIAQKLLQDSINNLNITSINNELLNITYEIPEQNKNIYSYNNINFNKNKDYKSLIEDNEKQKGII